MTLTRTPWLSLALAAACTLGLMASPAQAQGDTAPDPERVAAECEDRVLDVADRAVERNETLSTDAVDRIETHLANEHPRRAVVSGWKAKKRVRHQSQGKLVVINRFCRQCTRMLNRLEAEDLAADVQAYCEEQRERVKDSRRAALDAINEAIAPAREDNSAS